MAIVDNLINTMSTNIANTCIQDLTNYAQIIGELINILNEKESNVIRRRYGLTQAGNETLAAIGNDYNVTRERVRQIQSYALKKLQRNAKQTKLTEIKEWALNILKESGDIITEATYESQLKIKFPDFTNNLSDLKLATILFDEINYESNKIHFRPHFRKKELTLSNIKTITATARKILKEKNESFSQNQLITHIQEKVKEKGLELRKKTILSAIKLDRRITVKSDSISLTGWRHVNPKTLFDKILFVLNKNSGPMHFTEISNAIIDNKFDNKKVSQQAVHNELINKKEFVLVGRGVYALKEWGFTKGTVSDVIKEIIEENGPTEYHKLITSVLERRHVKPITIQININNKKIFHRDENNLVHIR